ncbi:HicA protein (modular protein) [Maridesulfovibrio hydrothermalis AM13 = DSM 14728]|uniref:HicA protein (Modular protein) n=2 Tax=Maridesulfovibrio TaxID=2794998 RepID=L0RCX0_9BACT|nr:HicA protein (modular protein) [Maridesulfovibrio hydrothermalis AM13 = DSM 14728]
MISSFSGIFLLLGLKVYIEDDITLRYYLFMNAAQKKTLSVIFSDPVNGNMNWAKIESLFMAVGCRKIEGKGSSVTFEKNGFRAYFHRPHPAKESLKYRVKEARRFLKLLGVKP